MAYKIAFFGAKPYDIASFDKINERYEFDIRYYKGHLNINNVVLTQGVDAVCIFVNDTADAAVIDALVANGVKLLALRCAGFNILKGLGMRVLANDLYPDEKFAKEEGITYVSLDELYKESDIISLHCPLTDQTRYLINDDSIAKMKDGVMIINTGRGLLIHTNALIEGLKTKKVSAAGLDVYEEEGDYFYEDKSDKIIDDDVLARLLSFNNVIVTSHQAFFTKEALHNIAETTLRNIKDFEEGRPLVNEVTK